MSHRTLVFIPVTALLLTGLFFALPTPTFAATPTCSISLPTAPVYAGQPFLVSWASQGGATRVDFQASSGTNVLMFPAWDSALTADSKIVQANSAGSATFYATAYSATGSSQCSATVNVLAQPSTALMASIDPGSLVSSNRYLSLSGTAPASKEVTVIISTTPGTMGASYDTMLYNAKHVNGGTTSAPGFQAAYVNVSGGRWSVRFTDDPKESNDGVFVYDYTSHALLAMGSAWVNGISPSIGCYPYPGGQAKAPGFTQSNSFLTLAPGQLFSDFLSADSLVGLTSSINEAVTFKLVGAPSWVSLSENKVSMVAPTTPGSYSFAVTATNACGLSARLPYAVAVGSPGTPPPTPTAYIDPSSLNVTTATPTITGTAANAASIYIEVFSPDGARVIANSPPSGTTVQSDGHWSFSMSSSLASGTYEVQVYDSYARNFSLTGAPLIVTIPGASTPPVTAGTPPPSAPAGVLAQITPSSLVETASVVTVSGTASGTNKLDFIIVGTNTSNQYTGTTDYATLSSWVSDQVRPDRSHGFAFFAKSATVSKNAWSFKLDTLSNYFGNDVLVYDDTSHALLTRGVILMYSPPTTPPATPTLPLPPATQPNPPAVTQTATIDASSLTANTATPTLTGTATNANGIEVFVTNTAGTVTYFNPTYTGVQSGRWSATVSPALSSGTYRVAVYFDEVLLASGTLSVSPVIATPPVPAIPTVTIATNPTSITAGASTQLTWFSTGTNSCTGTGFSTGNATSGSVPVSPSSTATYSVTCTSTSGQQVSANTSVTVAQKVLAPICNFLSAQPTAITSGAPSTLQWSTTNATSFSIDQGIGALQQIASGMLTVKPSVTTTYTGTAGGAVGTVPASCQAKVTVNAAPVVDTAPVVTLTPTSQTITSGTSAPLTWSSTGASSCTGTGFSTGNATSGNALVSPGSNATYSVTCTSAGGKQTTATVSVIVNPPQNNTPILKAPALPTVSLTPTSQTIVSGASGTLNWSSSGADSCTGAGFSTGNATSGSVSVSPVSNSTYSISCTGTGGQATANASVTVTQPPPPTCSLSALPTIVPSTGGVSMVGWTSTGATSLVLSGYGMSPTTVGTPAQGTVNANISGPVTVTAKAYGPGGIVNCTPVSISLAPPPAPAPVVTPTPATSPINTLLKGTPPSGKTNSGGVESTLQASALGGLESLLGIATPATNPATPTSSVARATAPVLCVAISHPLTLGSTDAGTGGDVTRLQQALAQNKSMYPEGQITGYYGPATARAVERVQTVQGIASSGTPSTTGYGAVGPKTRSVLGGKCSSAVAHPISLITSSTDTAPTVHLSVNGSTQSASVATGASAMLTWTSANVSSCKISSVPSSALSGPVETTSFWSSSGPLTKSTVFTITCVGKNGAAVSDSATVSIAPTVLSIA